MAYIKTSRPISFVTEPGFMDGAAPGEVLIGFTDRFDYISDGISPVTYPIIQMTLGEEVYNFEKEDVITATLVEEVNPISVDIPVSVLEFKIYSTDADFSMFSAQTQNLLVERFPILLYEKIDDDQIFLGKFYLSEWKNISENTFEFEAHNILGVMAETPFDGIYWETNTTLEDIFSQILDPIEVEYTLDPTLAAETLKGWIPPGDYREAIQQICFAGGAYVTTSRSSVLLINAVDLPVTPLLTGDEELGDDSKTSEAPLDLLKLVTGLELTSHDYADSENLVDIYEQELEPGNYKIIFDQPYYDIVVDGPGYVVDTMGTEDSAFNLTTEDDAFMFDIGGEYKFGPNALYLTVAETGTVTITGYPWIDSSEGYSWMEDDIDESTNKNALKITNATLVSRDIADDVLDRMVNYYRLRYKQTMTLFYFYRIQTQDIKLTSTYYDLKLLGLIKKVTSNLTGGFLQKVELVGIEDPT